MIHLDTNYVVAAVAPDTEAAQQLAAWMRSGELVEISVLVWSEFLCGPLTPAERAAATVLFPQVVPFSQDAASLAAELFNVAGRRRGSMIDCMIAATAIDAGAALATFNTNDFQRFVGSGLTLL